MSKKNLVLGTSVNFNIHQLKNFIMSFRAVNQVDDCMFFIDPVNKELYSDFFKQYNVITHSFILDKFVDTPVHNTRYIAYRHFLANNDQYQNIFLADTKDVVFQTNIFENLPEEFLYLFQEDSNFKFKNDSYANSYWLYTAYGNEVLHSFLEENVICSGTILGSYKEIVNLLELVNQELYKVKQNNPDGFKTTILDQAVVNFIGRRVLNSNPNVKVKVNGDMIATVGVTLNSDISTDKVLINGSSLICNNMYPAIIHQYDRNEVLKNIYDTKFVLN